MKQAAEQSTGVSRRRVLGTIASGGLVAGAGCLSRSRVLGDGERPPQIDLSIKTVPADTDPRATRLARFLAEKLTAVGVDADVVLMAREELYRDVLVNQQFDLYVSRLFTKPDPDFLRPLLHSRFAAESGWQNPFGYADHALDSLLERQLRETGEARQRTLAEVQQSLAHDQPFSPVAFVDEIRTVRPSRIHGWSTSDIHTPLGYLVLRPDAEPVERRATNNSSNGNSGLFASQHTPSEIRMTTTDGRALENLNPISPMFRGRGVITGLLYDSLGRRIDGRVRPWLAESWEWHDEGSLSLQLQLRDDLAWHDGTPLGAEDVAFTYRFLHDTLLGHGERSVPSPRFRGLESLVTETEVLDSQTVLFSLQTTNRAVARRALTVPVLPEHIWRTKTREAEIAGIDVSGTVPQALVWRNQDPVGSGPLRLSEFHAQESIALEPYPEHFLSRADDPHLHPYAGGFKFDRLVFTRAPSATAAVSMVREGDADATATGALPDTIPAIGRDTNLVLYVDRSRSLYHVGYNTRRAPLGNPQSRQATARLLDKAYLVENVFEDYATPVASPLARHGSLAPELVWEGTDPAVPFLGEAGELDVERARRVFQDAGYRYGNDGKLREV